MKYPGEPPQMRFYIPGTYVHQLPPGSDGESYSYLQLVEAARHVCWSYSFGEPSKFYRPGDIYQSVIDALQRADPGNFARLRRAYPLHAAMVEVLKTESIEGRSMLLNLLDYHTRPDALPTEEP